MADAHRTATLNDYTVTFHPAFASRCVVKCDDGEHEVYKQKEPHPMKDGEKHPVHHTIRLDGGKFERDICLHVHDPKHAIKSITVSLYGEGHEPGAPSLADTVETFTVDNTVITCPPWCGPII